MDVKRVMDVFAQAATRLEVKVNLLAAANHKKAKQQWSFGGTKVPAPAELNPCPCAPLKTASLPQVCPSPRDPLSPQRATMPRQASLTSPEI